MRLLLPILLTIFLVSCNRTDTLFSLLSERESGVSFNNYIEEDADNNVLGYGYFYNGGGVAAADFNNDGLTDLYFTGNMVANQLYLNRGDMHFEDISKASAADLNEGWKTGVSLVDINADGWMDMYICRAGAQDPNLRRNLLLVNQGKTKNGIPLFKEESKAYGLDDPSYSTQAVFFDYDKDGDVDCFLLNHSIQEYAGFSQLIASYRERKNEAYGNKLLRNDQGKFVNVTDSSGIVSNVLSFGLGINVSDLNQDGWEDIYISNDYNENDYLYLNQQDGTFKEVVREATGHVSLFSMGTDAADINNDGLTDLLTLDMMPASNERIKMTSGDDNYDKYQMLMKAGFHDQSMRNMLQLNNGANQDGVPVFSEIGQLAGVSNTDWSWSALMADFDNDGWKDIFISNGYARDYTNMEFLKFSMDHQLDTRSGAKPLSQLDIIAKMPAIDEHNYIFKNQHNLTFSNEVENWGLDQKSQSNGAVYTDLDQDGDLDLVTNNVGQKAFIYRNNTSSGKAAYLKIHLKGSYVKAVGAKVFVYGQDSLSQFQELMPVRGYQSSMYEDLHFGMGQLTRADSVKVVWADGKQQVVRNIAVNKKHIFDYKQAISPASIPAQMADKLFKEIGGIGFIHRQKQVNDYRIQTLLPEMLSYQGPFTSKWTDPKSGNIDLYIGGGAGQAAGFYRSQPSGIWEEINQPAFENDQLYQDGRVQFFDADGDGDNDLIIGSTGYALQKQDSLLLPRLYINEKGFFRRRALPSAGINAGAVAVADLDGDGDMDIMLGNRVEPGAFPLGLGAVILVNDGSGTFQNRTADLAPSLQKMGMITDAKWADLNKDGLPELVVICDWGAVHVLENVKGKLVDATGKMGLEGFIGNWKTIEIADLDGDGDPDLVLGNSGSNSFYHATSSETKIGLYAQDFDGLNRIVPVLTVFEKDKEFPYASRDELLDQIPSLKKKYPNYTTYATATMEDIFGPVLLQSSKKTILQSYQTGIFEQVDGRFLFHALPIQAQFSPVHTIAVVDLNQDGMPDIILGGNDSHARVRIGNSDANLIQVFQNTGKLNFKFVENQHTGLYARKLVRDIEPIFQKGKGMLVVTANNGPVSILKIAQLESDSKAGAGMK